MIISEAQTDEFKVEIWNDEDSYSPRDWDNIGTFITWDDRYHSPDPNDYHDADAWMLWWNGDSATCPNCMNTEDIIPVEDSDTERYCPACEFRWEPTPGAGEGGVALTVYKYEHSGVAYSTSPFSDPWDSGAVGVIFATAETIEKEYGMSPPDERVELTSAYLRNEVETYSKWANGEVYGFTVYKYTESCVHCHHGEWENIGSLGGLLGYNKADLLSAILDTTETADIEAGVRELLDDLVL